MKRLSKRLIILTCCLLASTCVLLTCGCAQQQASTQSVSSAASASTSTSSASSSSASAQDVVPVIGAGDTVVQVRNETGYDIEGVRIKAASAKDYTAENSFDGFVFEDGSTVDLSFDKVANADSYDVLLLTTEDSKIAIRDIDLVNTRDIVFHFEEGIGYITYTDATTGESFDNWANAVDAEEDAVIVPNDLQTQKG